LDPSRQWESLHETYKTGLVSWLGTQHWEKWQGLGDAQKQAPEQISGPTLVTKAKSLTFNRTESKALTGRLKGHNTLRRYLHLLGLLDSP
jgi:hypothetical protein